MVQRHNGSMVFYKIMKRYREKFRLSEIPVTVWIYRAWSRVLMLNNASCCWCLICYKLLINILKTISTISIILKRIITLIIK